MTKKQYTDLETNETGIIVLWKDDEKEVFNSDELIDLLNKQEETVNILKASNMEYEDALGRLEEQIMELESELATYKRKFLDCVDRKMSGAK